MPLYDFKCDQCGKTTEKLVKSSVSAIACECGSQAVKMINSTAKPKFNGSGFYETDFKTK